MQEKYYSKIKEKVYYETLDNGLKVVIMPMRTRKKFIIWGACVGSIDNKFKVEGEEETILPDGIAHYLEHKLFEQENGRNSLDVLTSIGVEANAFTSNNHTAYLFEATENFDEALDEFMDYVQNPYFTDENVEKERGIISQEIMMYDDYPEWAVYINLMKALYFNNEINIDEAGTVETIKEIDKDKLYKLYNAFYTPSNMILVLTGDFVPSEVIEKIKARIVKKGPEKRVDRIYNEEPTGIVQEYVEKQMDISMPVEIIGFKDNNYKENMMEKDVAIDIIGSAILGKSSKMYEKLYEEGKLKVVPGITYESAKTFGHTLIQFQADDYEYVTEEILKAFEEAKEKGISEEDFERCKRKIYGEYIRAFDDPDSVASAIVSDYAKGTDTFEYFDIFDKISLYDINKILKEIFRKDLMAISVVKTKEEG